MKRSFIQHIKRGCGKLPQCGYHPGTEIMITLIAFGACPGVINLSLSTMVIGAGIMAVLLLPIYLTGAYQRSQTEDQLDS